MYEDIAIAAQFLAGRRIDQRVRLITGLYAAGEITGHFYGSAPNAGAMPRALVFGRSAGKNATAQG